MGIMSLRVIDVIPLPGRRHIDPAQVETLASSIKEIGLQTPITVRADPESSDYFLVAGAHRLEAVKSLGHERIDCVITEMHETDARLWEIAENLHRAELSAVERAEQIAKWVRFTEEKNGVLAHVETKPNSRGGGPKGGVRAATRELGLDRREAQRAIKIAEELTPEAKAAAVETGLDNHQSALLKAAKAPKPEQAAVIHEIAQRKKSKPRKVDQKTLEARQKDRLVQAWDDAPPSVQQWFREFISNC